MKFLMRSRNAMTYEFADHSAESSCVKLLIVFNIFTRV